MARGRATRFDEAGPARRTQTAALLLLRIFVGVFMFFFGLEKASWLLDATPLTAQLSGWLVTAPPATRWYLDRVIPGAPVFARMVPLGAMVGGFALAIGFWTRIAAALSLVVVLSLQFAAGAMFHYAYLTDASGLPLVGALLALIIGGETRRVPKSAVLLSAFYFLLSVYPLVPVAFPA